MNRLPFILLALFLAACGGREELSPIELIAHGGGGIESHRYTNSLEAIKKSVANGYRYIEIDFSITSDSIMVAAHDWELFNKITGFEHKGDTAPTFADFSSRRILGKYTPLSAADINEIFENDTTIYLVTDKISSPELLARNFPHLKKRTLVEAFSYEDYAELRSQGYYRVFYSCMATDLNESLVKHLLLHPFFRGTKIDWITMYVGGLDNMAFRIIDALATFNIALFTVNNYTEIPCNKFHDVDRVKMIYTDDIKP